MELVFQSTYSLQLQIHFRLILVELMSELLKSGQMNGFGRFAGQLHFGGA